MQMFTESQPARDLHITHSTSYTIRIDVSRVICMQSPLVCNAMYMSVGLERAAFDLATYAPPFVPGCLVLGVPAVVRKDVLRSY